MRGDAEGRRLVKVFGDLAVEMQDADQGDATLRLITEAAVKIIPGVRWAGISLMNGRQVIPVVPTSDLVAELDSAQSAADEGPCLSALREHRTVHIADMATEDRWPTFATAAMERGVRSLLSFQLFVEHSNLGALNLYAGEPGVFDDEAVFLGESLAQHASVAMAGAAAERQFDTALSSRDVIGQAKGILMHRSHVNALQAFHMLLEVSQDTNTKLVEVARLVVADHEATLGDGARPE